MGLWMLKMRLSDFVQLLGLVLVEAMSLGMRCLLSSGLMLVAMILVPTLPKTTHAQVNFLVKFMELTLVAALMLRMFSMAM